MSNETKDLKESIQQNSVCINDGIFLLRVKKSDVNEDDFLKECVYGDAFPSAYSQHVSMIPTSVFLPKMFSGKTLFRDHKVTFKDNGTNRMKTEMIKSIDSLPPFAFLIHDHGDKQIETMYDDVFRTTDGSMYSEKRKKINTSLDSHLPNVKTTFQYPNEEELLLNNDRPDEEISEYLKENDECYTVLFITQYSSIMLQDSDESLLKFGDKNDPLFVELSNDCSARFDGVSNNEENCSVILPKSITLAVKRELLTLTQLYVGFEKQSGCIIEDYIHNIKCIFSKTYDQARNLIDMESYLVSALTLFFNQNLGQEQRANSKPILNDSAYKDTLKTKIFFQILMMVDRNSSFNMRNLKYKQDGNDKSYIMCDDVYTNQFMALTSAVYFNRSWLEHLLTLSTFFAKKHCRFACETCEQHVCAINAVSTLYPHSSKLQTTKRERTNALLAYHSSSIYNKTGPMGNLQTKQQDNATDNENIVVWEKYYENLYRTLVDNYTLDLETFAEKTETTSDNFEERAERIFEHISETIDNIVSCCDEFCSGLKHGAESIYGVKVVESEIRNQLVNLPDKGMLNVLLSESFLYVVRSIVLLEDEKQLNTKPLESWMCTFTAKFISSVKFCIIPKQAKDIAVELPRIAIKSYDENQTTVNVSTEKQTSCNLTNLLTQVTFKNKVFLYSRHDESKTNKRKSNTSMVQNMGNSSASTNVLNNTFAKFKQVCGQKTLQVLKSSDLDFIEPLSQIRDSKLDKHAYLFKNIKDFNTNEWPFIVMLITNVKLLEYLMFIPAYSRTNFLVFNKLAKCEIPLPGKEVMFEQSLICDEFNLCESVYCMKTTVSQFNSESKGLIKKIAGKYLDSSNEILSHFIKKSDQNPGPGVPIFYLPIGEKNIRSREKADILDQFINEQQYHLEKEAGYTNYIKNNRKQFYDSIFYATFGEVADKIENRYCSEIQEEMLSEFDDNFPPNLFINVAVQNFLKLVITEYLNTDQSAVQIMMSRLKEMSTRDRGLKRKSENDSEDNVVDFNLVNKFADDNDDTESMFLSKKAKLQ